MPRVSTIVRSVSFCLALAIFFASETRCADQVIVSTGELQGALNSDHSVLMFKGIPFAAPPTGDLRWKPPQPAHKWSGVRPADQFGPACMQTDVFGDIFFRDAQPSEDCLNLNIWLPASATAKSKLPVFVWYYGGGFVAGGNSEKRYDGEALAKKGIIVVEPNYRLGVFGFLSHPELTKESGHNSSGNYGLLDQAAALEWVVKNIAAFGGDPHNITIGGESAGSASVSALMASPLSRKLFQKAIGESGAFFSSRPGALQPKALPDSEQAGLKFAEGMGVKSLAELRAKSGDELLQAAAKLDRGFGFAPNLDGYLLPASVQNIYGKGEQARVPLLAGWNADEGKIMVLMNPKKPTAASFSDMAKERFGDHSAEFLKLYPASNDDEALVSAETLSGDDFIGFSTWKWMELQVKNSNSPVYRYHFEQVPKAKPGAMVGTVPASEAGARHACEIEYVFQTLTLAHEDTPWADDDFKVSEAMATYWTNFVKSGNPNSSGLPDWPPYHGKDGYTIMHLSGRNLAAAPDTVRSRYLFLDARSGLSSAK